MYTFPMACFLAVLVTAVAGATRQAAPASAERSLLREPVGPAFRGRCALADRSHPPAGGVGHHDRSESRPNDRGHRHGIHITPDLAGPVELESIVAGANGADTVGHGTKDAGIIAASGTDSVGLAGVCRTYRIFSLQASITASVSSGVIVVAAAGNDGTLVPEFPAEYPGMLAVGAVGCDGKRAAFSNRCPWVGVMAPGRGAALDVRDRVDGAFCRTSAAAAYVSGLAGLMKSIAPKATRPDIIAAIQRSARPTTGSAHGLVDAAGAIAAIKKVKAGTTGQTKCALLLLVCR